MRCNQRWVRISEECRRTIRQEKSEPSIAPASTPSCSARYERPSVGIEPESIAKNPREAKNFSCAARPRRVRAGFEFTKSISAKLRPHRQIKSTPGILRSINQLPTMVRTVLFYAFHRQYRLSQQKTTRL